VRLLTLVRTTPHNHIWEYQLTSRVRQTVSKLFAGFFISFGFGFKQKEVLIAYATMLPFTA
jgi:hypothetical protein